MPDHDVEQGVAAGAPGPAGEPELQDLDLRQEIELVADLVVAATASEGPLSLQDIDRILGVERA